jgi:hypothetical protein
MFTAGWHGPTPSAFLLLLIKVVGVPAFVPAFAD